MSVERCSRAALFNITDRTRFFLPWGFTFADQLEKPGPEGNQRYFVSLGPRMRCSLYSSLSVEQAAERKIDHFIVSNSWETELCDAGVSNS